MFTPLGLGQIEGGLVDFGLFFDSTRLPLFGRVVGLLGLDCLGGLACSPL